MGGGAGESNPINTLSFAAFLVVAVVALSKAGLQWPNLVRHNKAVFLIYAYLLCSTFWSEMPFVSLKRLIKDFETVLVASVFLSYADPAAAIRAVFVRVSYILFPLSLVFIKYFPDIGRSASRAGENMFTGVTTQKNSLGEMVFVLAIIILWDLAEIYKTTEQKGKRVQLVTRLGLLALGVWLLIICDSQTSLLCLILGVLVFLGSGKLVRMRNGKAILIALMVAAIFGIALDSTLGISEMMLRTMGRDPSLTGRTDIWHLVIEQQQSSLLGNGYFTFWDSEKGAAVTNFFMKINNAHNGYLETYLDGGLIGCVLLGLLLLTAGRQVVNRLFEGHPLGRVGLIFWLLAIVYNFSESSFFRPDVLWFTLLLVILEYPQMPSTFESPQVDGPIDEETIHQYAHYSG
jgi:O-antigen ligase